MGVNLAVMIRYIMLQNFLFRIHDADLNPQLTPSFPPLVTVSILLSWWQARIYTIRAVGSLVTANGNVRSFP